MASTQPIPGTGYQPSPGAPRDDKPQNRTMLWASLGVLVLIAILWLVSSSRHDDVDNDRMNNRNTEQTPSTTPASNH